MKPIWKYFLISIVVVIVGVVIFLNIFQFPLDICDEVGVMFLKPSEVNLTQGILERNPNTIVVIPESNEIRGNSATLNCPNLNLNPYDYLGVN